MDWKKQGYEDEIHVMQVDPHNLNSVRGELPDIILSGSKISYGYDTDTRVSATLQAYGNNYIEDSWLRITHKRAGVERELGTFVLQNSPPAYEGNNIYSYDLQSVLWTMSNDLCSGHFSIGAGAYSKDVFERICKTCGRSYVHAANARNYRYSASKVFDAGESYLSFLFDICDAANNRLNVDGHGRITDAAYYTPGEITPSWTLDADATDSMIIKDSIKISSSSENVPGRAIVIHTNGDKEIIATADRKSDSPYSAARRGYMIANTYNVSDMTPETVARAQQLAQRYLNESARTTELQCTTLYFPCETGQTARVVLDKEQKKWQIKSVEISLDSMTQQLTLKEVG